MTSPSQEELRGETPQHKRYPNVFAGTPPVPNEPSDNYDIECDYVDDVCMSHQFPRHRCTPSAIGDELDSLYRPEITDLEKNEYQGNDRPVIYLADAKRVLKEQTKLARVKYERSGMAFVHSTVLDLFDDQKALKKLDKIIQERLDDLEASIKERSEG